MLARSTPSHIARGSGCIWKNEDLWSDPIGCTETLVTLAEGEITELHVGLKGTMNALFLKDLAAKTRRAACAAGSRRVAPGQPVLRLRRDEDHGGAGERTINDAEAAIVGRVFRDFAAGVSPRAIARRLNAESVPGPSGKLSSNSMICGHAKRGTGFINNKL